MAAATASASNSNSTSKPRVFRLNSIDSNSAFDEELKSQQINSNSNNSNFYLHTSSRSYEHLKHSSSVDTMAGHHGQIISRTPSLGAGLGQKKTSLGAIANPSMAWKQLNDDLNHLFPTSSSATRSRKPSGEVLHHHPHHPNGGNQHHLLQSKLTKSSSRTSLYGGDIETTDGEDDQLYHTVHGGRKNTVTASRKLEPFSKIVRRRQNDDVSQYQQQQQMLHHHDSQNFLGLPQLAERTSTSSSLTSLHSLDHEHLTAPAPSPLPTPLASGTRISPLTQPFQLPPLVQQAFEVRGSCSLNSNQIEYNIDDTTLQLSSNDIIVVKGFPFLYFIFVRPTILNSTVHHFDILTKTKSNQDLEARRVTPQIQKSRRQKLCM